MKDDGFRAKENPDWKTPIDGTITGFQIDYLRNTYHLMVVDKSAPLGYNLVLQEETAKEIMEAAAK